LESKSPLNPLKGDFTPDSSNIVYSYIKADTNKTTFIKPETENPPSKGREAVTD
jgi:hypothetical protein